MSEEYDEYNEKYLYAYNRTIYIDKNGMALDESFNTLVHEDGSSIIIKPEHRHQWTIIDTESIEQSNANALRELEKRMNRS